MNSMVGKIYAGAFLFALAPLLLAFLAKYGFVGLFKGRTLTHIGVRTGWLARVYGAFYCLLLILYLIGFIEVLPFYTNLGLTAIIGPLLLPLPHTDKSNFLGLFFIGLGLVALVAARLLWTFSARRYPGLQIDPKHLRARTLYLYDFVVTLEVVGLFIMIGAPMGLFILVLAGSGYIFPILGVSIEDVYPPQKSA